MKIIIKSKATNKKIFKSVIKESLFTSSNIVKSDIESIFKNTFFKTMLEIKKTPGLSLKETFKNNLNKFSSLVHFKTNENEVKILLQTGTIGFDIDFDIDIIDELTKEILDSAGSVNDIL